MEDNRLHIIGETGAEVLKIMKDDGLTLAEAHLLLSLLSSAIHTDLTSRLLKYADEP